MTLTQIPKDTKNVAVKFKLFIQKFQTMSSYSVNFFHLNKGADFTSSFSTHAGLFRSFKSYLSISLAGYFRALAVLQPFAQTRRERVPLFHSVRSVFRLVAEWR